MSLEQNVGQGNSDTPELFKALTEISTAHPGIRCYWCTLDYPAAALSHMRTWLSVGERARMLRFGSALLQDRYAMGRGSLRFLLARHLGLAPENVPISRGERGRPQLHGIGGIDFNVSHTENVALFAIATSHRVGVDIEHAARVINARGIARKFLTQEERDALVPLSEEQIRAQVLRLWTCKEAMSKATGDALSAPFAKMRVETTPTLALGAGPTPYHPERWRLSALAAPQGYIATLAVWRS